MSAQGAFPEEPPAELIPKHDERFGQARAAPEHPQGTDASASSRLDIKLIETLRWTGDEGFYLLDRHLARLENSASELGFCCDIAALTQRLGAVSRWTGEPAARLRIRVLLARDGTVSIDATPFDMPKAETIFMLAQADLRLWSADPWLRHKTTHRAPRDAARERARQATGADEVFFVNERGEVCEGSYTTIFLPRGEHLLTPPLSAGLLPGILRAELLATGRALEATLLPADLVESPGFFVGNALRGLIPARFLSPSA